MRFGSPRLLAAIASLVVLAACGGSNAPTSGGNVSLKIMVGGLNKQIYLPNMLAQRLGYFKAENLDGKLIEEGSGQASEEEILAGHLHGAPRRVRPPHDGNNLNEQNGRHHPLRIPPRAGRVP